MVETLALVLQHDEHAVVTAVEMALDAGVPTKTRVLKLLHRIRPAHLGWMAHRQSCEGEATLRRSADNRQGSRSLRYFEPGQQTAQPVLNTSPP